MQRLDVPTPARRAADVLADRPWARRHRAERRILGAGAATYRFWVTESAPYDRRLAATMFPGWLADHWGVPTASQLPGAAFRRVTRHVAADGDDLSTRRAP